MSHRWKSIARMSRLALLLLCAAVSCALGWPPVADRTAAITHTLDGRKIERFTHAARDTWGYPHPPGVAWAPGPGGETGRTGQNLNSFYLVHPGTRRKHPPLCVVLHSANRTAFDYLGYQFLNRKIDAGDDPAAVVTRTPDDCLVLFLNSTNDEWWGWGPARRQPAGYASRPTPGEQRILDTIEWVASRYRADRNRIYLSGVSMGGCGALAVGLANGDVFAAVAVFVPAGTEYAAWRMRFPAAAGRPEPPVLLDFSAQNDGWSKTQPALLEAAEAGGLPLVLTWGPFGHTAFSGRIARFPHCAAALAYPWTRIRKNEAYPVFTNASSDQRSPWRAGGRDFDEHGQMNAYFRWKSLQDKPTRFRMQLWLAHPNIANAPANLPQSSTAGITLRRLQHFRVEPGKVYRWRLTRWGAVDTSGEVEPDTRNLLTIPRVTITTAAAELRIEQAGRSARIGAQVRHGQAP